MADLDRLASEVRGELGEPSPDWLLAHEQRLRRTLTTGSAEPPTRRRVVGRALALAAALATLAVALFAGNAALRGTAPPTEEVLSAPTGDRRVKLRDGSSLSLRELSLARVSEDSERTRCTVEVGTVDFDVAPQKGRTFSVLAGAFEVRVVGTRFRVSRAATGSFEVWVAHGRVRVLAPNREAPIELEAGDRLRGDEGELLLTHPGEGSGPSADAPWDGARSEGRVSAAPEPEASAPSEAPRAAADRPAGESSARDEWQGLYRKGDYRGAVAAAKQQGIERLLETLGAGPLAELGDAARLATDNQLALRALAAVERRYPGSPQAADATFLSARIYAGGGQADAAVGRFEKYLASNPRGTYSLEATGRLVELYAARGDPRAKATARTYLERSPHGPYQRLCRSVLARP